MAHNCVFMTADYRRTISLAGKGDVVYCDPPYEPMPGTTGFTAYAAGGFNWENQVDLAKQCVSAFHRGARVVILTHLHRRFSTCTGSMVLTCNSSTRAVRSPAKAVRGKSQKTL
jgi:site-specific DNA-adenine methylase